MQTIQPKIPIDRHPAHGIKVILRRRAVLIRLAIPRRVQIARRGRIAARLIQHLRKEGIGIELENRGVGVRRRQVRRQPLEAKVEGGNVRALEVLRRGAEDHGSGRAVDGRHVDEEEVACAGLVELVDEVGVGGEDGGVEGGVLFGVAVAHVVDAEEGAEEGIGRGPVVGEVEHDVVGDELVVDLRAEVEHDGQVWGDEAGVHRRAAKGEVVGFDKGFVVDGC